MTHQEIIKELNFYTKHSKSFEKTEAKLLGMIINDVKIFAELVEDISPELFFHNEDNNKLYHFLLESFSYSGPINTECTIELIKKHKLYKSASELHEIILNSDYNLTKQKEIKVEILNIVNKRTAFELIGKISSFLNSKESNFGKFIDREILLNMEEIATIFSENKIILAPELIHEFLDQIENKIIHLEEYMGTKETELNIIFAHQNDSKILSNFFIKNVLLNQTDHDVIVDIELDNNNIVDYYNQDLESNNIGEDGRIAFFSKKEYSIIQVKELESITSFRIMLIRLKMRYEINQIFINHIDVFPPYLHQSYTGTIHIIKELHNLCLELKIRMTLILDKALLDDDGLTYKIKSLAKINIHTFSNTDNESLTLLK